MFKIILALLVTLASGAFAADKTLDFNYKDADIAKVLKDYSEASGQKFIIGPTVKGKISITNHEPVGVTDAFNQLSTALALNGLGISKQEDTMIVMEARNLQRNYIEVGQELPPLKPERMFTWVVNLKFSSADEMNKQLRILTSRDGELVPYTRTNQIIITDWTTNLYRVSKILKELDIAVVAKAPAKPDGKIK